MKTVKLKKLAKRILTKYSDGHYTQFAGHENIIMAMKECAKDYHKQQMEEIMPEIINNFFNMNHSDFYEWLKSLLTQEEK